MLLSEWWGTGVVICLEQDADLHMAQLMPLPLTVSCFSKIQIGLTFLVPAHVGSLGQRAVKRVCVCVCVLFLTASLYVFICMFYCLFYLLYHCYAHCSQLTAAVHFLCVLFYKH